ncbi:MAG: Rieske (2Fe-2S) protein, partial [Acidimicrobiia bacterium]
FPAADVAGRLGVVHRDPQSPVGPLAVYHLRGRLHAVDDRCPHAGATLSEGEVEGCVVTCPRHGSQFDVSDGERVRGPADQGLRTFTLVEEGGQVYLVLPST